MSQWYVTDVSIKMMNITHLYTAFRTIFTSNKPCYAEATYLAGT